MIRKLETVLCRWEPMCRHIVFFVIFTKMLQSVQFQRIARLSVVEFLCSHNCGIFQLYNEWIKTNKPFGFKLPHKNRTTTTNCVPSDVAAEYYHIGVSIVNHVSCYRKSHDFTNNLLLSSIESSSVPYRAFRFDCNSHMFDSWPFSHCSLQSIRSFVRLTVCHCASLYIFNRMIHILWRITQKPHRRMKWQTWYE